MLGLRYCSQHDIIKLYFYQTLEYRKILNIFKNQVNRKLSIMGINKADIWYLFIFIPFFILRKGDLKNILN